MMRRLKLVLSQAITAMAWESIYKRREIGRRIPVLCYHRVLPELIEDENDPLYTLTPEQFESHLAFLAQEGFTSLSLEEFGEIARGAKPRMKRAVVITFDDGYADNYAIAWSLAQKYGIKLNLFVSTRLIEEPRPVVMAKNGYRVYTGAKSGNESLYFQSHLQKFPHLWRPLTWQELGEMRQAGVGIGLHGHSHRNLGFLTPEELAAEVTTGLEIFQDRMGYSPDFFALPYGGYETNTSDIISILRQYRFNYIFTAILGRAPVPSDDVVFPRLLIYQQDSLEVFRRKLFGAYDWLEPASRLLHAVKSLVCQR